MDFVSYRETGHIGGPSGKGHIRALDIGGIRRYREISHVWPTVITAGFSPFSQVYLVLITVVQGT